MLILRGSDRHGSGNYMAGRGSRVHHGIDISAAPDSKVCPQILGEVTKIGWPYSSDNKKHYRYVQITDSQGNAHRLFYVSPSVAVGDVITVDLSIGEAQDLTTVYPGIINHIHYEIIDSTGAFIDPMEFLL